jgi:hypothetical protein
MSEIACYQQQSIDFSEDAAVSCSSEKSVRLDLLEMAIRVGFTRAADSSGAHFALCTASLVVWRARVYPLANLNSAHGVGGPDSS